MEPDHAFPAHPRTAEAAWARLVAHAPELALSTRPVVVVAPHPDDETLAVGGCIHRLREREVALEVVAVTDGEASHPDSAGLAARRRREQEAALADLGVAIPPLRLGLADTRVADHEDELARALIERCDASTVLIAPWKHDGHADHDACGRAATRTADAVGCALWSYPVWAWQWATTERLAAEQPHRISLSGAMRTAKQRAIGRYRSQTEQVDGPPVVGPAVLATFQRPWEAIFRVR